jgi:CBS domain-containing protein
VDIEFNLNTESVKMTNPAQPMAVEPTVSIRQVFGLLRNRDLAGSVLICHEGLLVGIFTERDALRVMASGADLDAPIETVMIRRPSTLATDATVAEVIRRMSGGGVRRLPIIDGDGKPTGIVRAIDVVHYLVEHFPKSVYNLPPVARQVMQEREGP